MKNSNDTSWDRSSDLPNKAVPLQAWTGPKVYRKLRFPDFVTTAQDGGKVVSLTHRPPLPNRKYSWYPFLLDSESTGRILCQWKISNYPSWHRTSDIAICSTAPWNIMWNVNQRQDVQLHHVSIITVVWRHRVVFLKVRSLSRMSQRWYKLPSNKLPSNIRNESCLKSVVAYWDNIFGGVSRE